MRQSWALWALVTVAMATGARLENGLQASDSPKAGWRWESNDARMDEDRRDDEGFMYELGPVDINCGGRRSVGGNYVLTSSLAQAGGAGVVSASHTTIQIGFWSAAAPRRFIPPDFDRDGDVDIKDFNYLVSCWTGPAMGPPASGCENADLNEDGQVDQVDFGLFQRCFTGTGVPADPRCVE